MASTAAVTFPGPVGLSPSRVPPRNRPAEMKLEQQRPSPKNIHIISRIPSKSLQPVKASSGGVPLPPLDLTEENIQLVLADARVEVIVLKVHYDIFYSAVTNMFDAVLKLEKPSGQVELSELDGPFVKISLKGRFWHKRSTVVARVGNYLKQRIPEILEVEIEDEKQLDDSPENF